VQQSKAVNPKSIKHKMNDENKDDMIELLRLKVKDLEHKNKELTKQLQKHQGNIYDQIQEINKKVGNLADFFRSSIVIQVE
jgi:chaperonin cofactor prefoldin